MATTGKRLLIGAALVVALLLIWAALSTPVGERHKAAPTPELPPTLTLTAAALPSPTATATTMPPQPAIAAYPSPAAPTAAASAHPSPEAARTIPAQPPTSAAYPAAQATDTPTPTATPTPQPTPTPRPPMPTPTRQAVATPYPAPTPLAMTTGTKRSNIGPYLLAPPEFGQPTHNLLKSGHMRAYMAVNPAHWGSLDRLPNMEGYGRNWIPPKKEIEYIEDGVEGARRYYARFEDTYEATRGDIHAWMSTWAFTYDNEAFAERWVAFQREWLRLMHEHGYKAGIGGMRTHRFKTNEIRRLAPAIAEADYLFLSEAGAPTIRGSFYQTVLLYRRLRDELRGVLREEQIPPFILDICVDGRVLADLNKPGGPWWQRGYIQFETSKENYMADVRAYDLETLKDPYVQHVFWFATNITQDTHSFDVDTNMLAVADGWHVGR